MHLFIVIPICIIVLLVNLQESLRCKFNQFLACLFAMFAQEPLIQLIGMKVTYLFGLLTFAISMCLLVAFPCTLSVNLCGALSGFGTAVANTIPGTLVTKYNTCPELYLSSPRKGKGSIHGMKYVIFIILLHFNVTLRAYDTDPKMTVPKIWNTFRWRHWWWYGNYWYNFLPRTNHSFHIPWSASWCHWFTTYLHWMLVHMCIYFSLLCHTNSIWLNQKITIKVLCILIIVVIHSLFYIMRNL